MKQTQTRRLNTHYFRVRKSTARGVASCPNLPSTTVYSSSDSNSVHKECNHLRRGGLRHKELYYNVCEKNHVVGAFGYGSVTMPDESNPYVEELLSMDNSDIERVPDEDLTSTNCGWDAGDRRPVDDVGPSRSRGSVGKRKRRDAMDEMIYMAMQEIVTYLRSRSQSGANNNQSSRIDHLLMCMNCMTEMGIPPYQRAIMWHYFDAHPRTQRTFHRLCDDDRRGIIASVVQSQSPPAP